MEVKDSVQLSYSSGTLLKNCEQRYAHYKVYGTPIDTDAEESTEAFDIGKAFHHVLEHSRHGEDRDMTIINSLIKKAIKEYDVEEHEFMITAMVYKYLNMHWASGLQVLFCEAQVSDQTTVGYIDVGLIDPSTKVWWLGDLKTSGRWVDSKLAALARDVQLTQYSKFKDRIADGFGLDANKFGGCRYRVTTKSKLKRKDKEAAESYVKRIMKSTKSLDIVIPAKELDVELIWEEHLALHKRALELHNGEVPKRNYSYCEAYFKPCPYWSQCYGSNFTENHKKVMIYDENRYNELNLV